jgi:hypothetical protein
VRRDRPPAVLVQGLRDLFGYIYRRVGHEGVFRALWGEMTAKMGAAGQPLAGIGLLGGDPQPDRAGR